MPPKAPDAKATLRRDLLRKREALSEATRTAASDLVVAAAARLIAAERPQHVGLYLPVRGEVDLTALPTQASGVVFALPVVAPAGRKMTFHAWRPGVTPLARNRFDIDEPIGAPAVAFGPGDLLLVPCLAIDRRGFRLGYGGGYYDAFLATTRAIPIGVAYASFVVPNLPSEDHDRRISRVLTETGLQNL